MSVLNTAQPKALFDFTNGITHDQRLAAQEIKVQKAWLWGLVSLDLINKNEADAVCKTLDEAQAHIEAGTFEWQVENEDIHMHLEQFVTEKLGDIGKRMHMGRSRNDLIATTLRLYVADTLQQAAAGLDAIIATLEAQINATHDVIVPGMTHLQHGQPVRFSHILVGHKQALQRDQDKLAFALTTALQEMPLGAAALAGTTLPVDLKTMAEELGFCAPAANSYDAVGNRDFMLNALDAFASIALHFARLSEDMIYWSSTAVGLVQLPANWSTGSSIMPNKRNPDVPELTRGKAAHIIAAQNNGYMLMRTVPTSYGSDLHELKQVYMRALDEVMACFNVWPGFIAELSVSTTRAAELCMQGHILATEIANHMVETGTPFREAYKKVADLVKEADAQGKQVHELYTDANFTPLSAVQARKNVGGTGIS